MARERKNLAAGDVVYNFKVSTDLDIQVKTKLIEQKHKRKGGLDQKDFLAELVAKGLKSY